MPTPNKMEVVKEFPKCPWCDSTEICSELAIKHLKLREKGLVKKDDFVSSSKIMVPLYNPVLAALTLPMMIQEIDACGECGRNRVVRVSIAELPVSMMKPQGSG